MKTSGLLAIAITLLFISCRKDSFITSPEARVTITADTLKYDTVFVTAGSIYQTFKIINENNQKLKLSSIRLMGGSASSYKMNVDGISGTQFENLEIEANDSVYVFVQVNVDPNASNLPFIIRDSVQVQFNGQQRLVQLEAWGQNAHFFRDRVISVDETWNNDLPYVILGSLLINPNRTLTINKGCRIYVHADAPIVVDGTLLVNGLKDTLDRIYFRGDRLDEPYRDFPASWPGIFFRTSSKDNRLTYAVIKNAFQAIGIQDLPSNLNPKLTLNECIIDNAYEAGIVASRSTIVARNCLISNCGNNLFLARGGDYQFTNCTVVTIANRFIDHRNPVLQMSNYVVVGGTPMPEPLNALFRNCIFWGENGTVDNEIDILRSGTGLPYNVVFDYNAWKVTSTPANITASAGILNNQDPVFDSVDTYHNHYNFRLKSTSTLINKGTPTGAPATDLDGRNRPLGIAPDLGAFEKQ